MVEFCIGLSGNSDQDVQKQAAAVFDLLIEVQDNTVRAHVMR